MAKPKGPIRELSEVEKAYIAGIIDGEGSIQLTRQADKSMRLGYQVVLIVHVSSTTPALLEWLVERTGAGRRIQWQWANKNPRARPAHRWRLYAVEAASLLQQIRPYLVLKGAQADIAIAFNENKQNARKTGCKGKTPEEMSTHLGWWEQMRQLNKRGVA